MRRKRVEGYRFDLIRGHPPYLTIWVEGAFHAAATDIQARAEDEPDRPEHNDRRRSGFAIETGDALLRGIWVRRSAAYGV